MYKLWKRMALILLVAALACCFVVTLVACNGNDDKAPTHTHVDSDEDGKCDVCEEHMHIDKDDDHICDICEQPISADAVRYQLKVQRNSKDGIENVTVSLRDSSGRIAVDINDDDCVAITDSKGLASFYVDKGDYTVRFSNLPAGFIIDDQQDSKLTADTLDYTFTFRTELLPIEQDQRLYTLGSVVADYTVQDVNGVQYKFSDVLKNKKMIILNFWYTTCGPCMTEFPEMKRLYEEDAYKGKFELFAFDPIQDFATVKNYEDANHMGFPIFWDHEIGTQNMSLAARFTVQRYPTTVVIDREGVVVFTAEGMGTYKDFQGLVDKYSAEPYQQDIVFPGENITDPKPNVDPVPSEQIEAAINNKQSGFDFSYYMAEDDGEYNWPWLVGSDSKGSYIYPSNSEKDSSWAILRSNVSMQAGQVLAFDYEVSCEEIWDEFDAFIDNQLVLTLYGQKSGTAYVHVAQYDGDYELALAYSKDESGDAGDDLIKIRNMRFVGVNDISEQSDILLRAAVGDNGNAKFDHYITPVYNEQDGYYHVDDANGPLLLADLMNTTAWGDSLGYKDAQRTIWTLIESRVNTANPPQWLSDLTMFCQYANNSSRYGLIAVTEELKSCLINVARMYGNLLSDGLTPDPSDDDTTEWVSMCKYIMRYHPDGAEQMGDPAAGLNTYNAFEAKLNADPTGAVTDPNELESSPKVKNHVVVDRVIVPRGIWYKFVPDETAVYRIRSYNEGGAANSQDTYGWLRDANGDLIQENDELDFNPDDMTGTDGNFVMQALLMEGQAYYICCAFNAVEQLGEFDFIITKLAAHGSFWTNASLGEYTFRINPDGSWDESSIYLKGAIDYALGSDDVYRAADSHGDPIDESKIYINLGNPTFMFPSMSFAQMVNNSYAYVCQDCGWSNLSGLDEAGGCSICGSKNLVKQRAFVLPEPVYENGKLKINRQTYGSGDEQYYVDFVEYKKDGDGKVIYTDYTATMQNYVNQSLDNYPSDDFDGDHRGFCEATAELVEIIKRFIIFGDFAFSPNIDNAWLMTACYYLYIE